MRAPNPAEMQPPIPNTEIQIANTITPPITPEVTPAYSFRRAIGRASVILATTSLASAGLVGAGHGQVRHDTDVDRAERTATNTYTLDHATRVARESTNVYTGRVTLAAMTKTARHAAPGDNTGIAVAKIMGVPEADVKQGKKTEVTIAGRRVDLADYATDNRKAESWKESKDCAWNWAIDDLAILAKEANLNPEQTKKVMHDPKAIKRVMGGYLTENPDLKEDSQHFLTTGVSYKAKHARAEAKKLVGAIQATQDPDTKPAAPNKTQPQPDAKRSSAAARPLHIPTKSAGNKNKEMVAGIMKLSGLAGITGLVLAGGALIFGRRRRRNEENELSEKRAGNHRAPDPDDPNDPNDPPEDLSDLRRETEKDKAASWGRPVEPAPIRRPVTNQAINNYGPVELDSNARHLRSVDTFTATSTDVPARSRFSRPSQGRSEVPADVKLSDAPTDPSVAVVLPFPPQQIPRRYAEPVGPPNTGWISPDVYVGMHRKQYVDGAESDAQKKAVAV